MSSLFNHIFIPVVVLLIIRNHLKIDQKKIMALSFFGILPDADALIFVHRATFHNIFILIIPILLFIFLKDYRTIFGIITFYLASHLILDIFNGGIYSLYPFFDNVQFVRAEGWFDNGNISFLLDYGINNKILSVDRRESIISSESVGIIILFIIAYIPILWNKLYNDYIMKMRKMKMRN